ncbi:MAG: hypothetical protein U0414_23000 [Polyangiaceae bacterium]
MTKRRARARTPVVTVSCPNCGGAVNEAELGEKTSCQFCGTRLHLPVVEFDDEGRAGTRVAPSDPEAPTSSAVVVAQPFVTKKAPARWFVPTALFGVVAMLGFVFFVTTRRHTSVATTPDPDPASPAVARPGPGAYDLAGAECLAECVKPCTQISDSDAMMSCLDKCQAKCSRVGKGNPAECRQTCGSLCAAAPDEASRAACVASCSASCP